MRSAPSYLTIVLAVGLVLTGCTGMGAEDLELPAEWETDFRGRWWVAGTDTSFAFRDLETLQSMGVQLEEVVYDGITPLSEQGRVGEERMIRYVKQSLVPLFRNRPDVVDSLFNLYVSPKIRKGGTSSDPAADVARYKRDGYRTIYRYFHDPRTILQVGKDIDVNVPDSLRAEAAGRKVTFQVFISAEGEPHAIELLTGVHPVLDRIALKTTAAMRWQPAYLLKGRKSIPLEAWVRFSLRFPG